jgi:serine/threonine protein kinase/TolB-like protein/Tfp pilus assembly protein PilF
VPTERWERLEQVFVEARERPAEARSAFLTEACAPDPSLEDEARSLLDAADSSGEFMNGPALDLLARQMAAEDRLRPGDRLGPYEVEALLGVGGMGEVYRGRDTRLGRDVALKVISPRLVEEPSLRRRFELEARAASVLNHPSIVTIYDVGESEGISWIAMEWVEGRTLRQAIAEGPLPIRDAVSIARQLAEGLAAAHAKGVVHRDLKPENVMLAVDGRSKILDFGLARQTFGETVEGAISQRVTLAVPASGATGAGTILGTVGYMSPEQAAGRTADFRSDQFSLGLVAYEMLTGRRAFARPSAVETLSAIIREEPVPMSSLREGIPKPVQDLIATCLAKSPEDRFASTRELASALEAVGTGLSGASSVPARIAAMPRRPLLRRPALALGASLAVALGVAAWMKFQASRNTIDSLAVLPFANAGQDPEAEYLGDGLTESLIDQMSRLPSLRVMARATVFRFKGTADPQEAGRKLGVGAVVTGTVSRRGDRISISAELIEIATGARLWGEHYDRPSSELLSVQDGIASQIADGLRLRLTGQEKRALGQHGTGNPEAYELFLKARSFQTRDTEEGELQARKLFLQALEKDPRFAEAHLGVAATYARSAGSGYARPVEAWARVEEEARKALALDPGNVRARLALANRRFAFDWDWVGSEREFAELSPDPRVVRGPQFHAIAGYFWARGRPQESVALVERALRVDPQNLESRIMLADYLAQAGRLEEAIEHYRAIARDEPAEASPLFGLAELLRRQGDLKGAIDALRKAYELSGEEHGARALATARTETDYESAERAVARVRLADLEVLAKERYVSPLDFARLYATVGEREKAFASLEAALAERSPGLVYLKVDRAWDPIRDDPRFTAVVRRVGIP